jgi:hypothetical protein
MLSTGLLIEADGVLSVRDWQDYQPRQVAIDPSRVGAGAHPGRAGAGASRGAHRNERTNVRDGVTARAREGGAAASWDDYDRIEWQPFRDAWVGRGFLWAPSGEQDGGEGQRAILWEIAAARPTDLGRWVREAPAGDRRAVIAYVLDRWHEVKAAIPPDPKPRPRREKSGPTPLSVLLADAKAAGL